MNLTRYNNLTKKILVLFAITFLTFSCNNSPKNKVKEEILQWKNKEIVFPKDMALAPFATDTLHQYKGHPYKVLMYVDSIGCTPCKLRLEAWRLFIEEMDKKYPNQVGYLFYFANKKLTEVEELLHSEEVNIPAVVDEGNMLNELNQFSANPNLHCFLLDKNNRVKVIGNPIYNQKIKELYLSTLKQ